MKFNSIVLSTVLLCMCVVTGLNAQEKRTPPNSNPDRERISATSFRVKPTDTPYERWFTANKGNMPSFEGLLIQDARTEPLEHWEQFGVDGLYIKMADYQITDGWILEIPPGGSIKPQRHLFEAGMYFFGGPGRIMLQQEGRRPQQIEYGHRALYSVPPMSVTRSSTTVMMW